MRLEPVYLVAPKPKPPSMTRRRALAGMGMCLVVGLSAGGACGYSLGRGAETAAGGARESTGNAELDELRRLAAGPIEELNDRFIPFYNLMINHYATDAVLWKGMGRLGKYLIDGAGESDRRLKTPLLINAIEKLDPPLEIKELLPALRSVR